LERFNTHLELTTTETASLLEVHASTVKRWCNDGLLDFDTTEGGHRRIHLQDAVAFSRQQGIQTVLAPFHPYEPHVWNALRAAEDERSFRALHTLTLGWVMRGDTRRVEQLYSTVGKSSGIDFCTFCDEGIRGLMRLVGQAWADGRIRVGEEHMLSQAMIDVLQRLRSEWLDHVFDPYANGTEKVAVVGTLEGNQHHLGTLCVRILLERRGWQVHYLGPDVPVDDFGVIQKGRGAQMVCISLGPEHTVGDVSRSVTLLASLYDRSRPYDLVFGGAPRGTPHDGFLSGPFRSVRILDSCVELATLAGDQASQRPKNSEKPGRRP
jgi:excisionase family DNA binding protein